jgi:hypothetical protein
LQPYLTDLEDDQRGQGQAGCWPSTVHHPAGTEYSSLTPCNPARHPMSPPARYSFVNARPQTKAERKQTRTAIRSHIGRWTQEKQQRLDLPTTERDKQSPSGSSRTISASPTSSDQPQQSIRGKFETQWVDASDSASSIGDPNREFLEDDLDDAQRLASNQRQRPPRDSLSASTSVIQVLGSGLLDPFYTLPTNFPAELISQCHEYCKQPLASEPQPRVV